MNIALPAVVFFFLALPGFLFRSRLKRAEQTSVDYSPFGRVVMEAVLWGAGLHIVWLLLGAYVFGEAFRIDTLLELLSSAHEEQSSAFAKIQANQGGVARYFFSLYAAAFVVPTVIRSAITRWRLDRYDSPLSGLFRFNQAPWYYLLTAADFPSTADVDYIQVAAVVDVAGEPILFTGVLDDFFFDADGQLDRLILEAVTRRPFNRDKVDANPGEAGPILDRFYSVDGDYFVIKYEEVITLNIQYIKWKPLDEAADTSSGGGERPTVLLPTSK